MQLQAAISEVFDQLQDALQHISDTQYRQPSVLLSQASVGEHLRHILEVYICLLQGYETGIINYENRKRDQQIETDKVFANQIIQQIREGIDKPNKILLLEASYTTQSIEPVKIDTNYFRELAYNLEHTIHHMALIKIGIQEMGDWPIPPGFGVAYSTLKYRMECAQ